MTKLDWSKAGQANPDPGRASKSDAEFRAFPPTPSGRKEYEQAKKARSAAAKQAAKTRKVNRERAEDTRRQAELDALGRAERDKAFFARIQENLNLRRQQRDAKARDKHAPRGSLGTAIAEALTENLTK